jgi:LicD family
MSKYREWYWTLRWKVALRLIRMPVVGRAFASVSDRVFVHRFTTDLHRMNDVLEGTELAGRYWIRAGLLLGCIREQGLLAHDRDADFGVLREDLPRLLRAVPALREAGFQPLQQFRNNDGQLTELTFRRYFAKYEFFVLEPVDGMFRYYVYGWPPDNLYQVEKQVPEQSFVPVEFLGRTWLRPADSERELEFMYGDWRTPQRKWNYLQDGRNGVDRKPWVNADTSWSE